MPAMLSLSTVRNSGYLGTRIGRVLQLQMCKFIKGKPSFSFQSQSNQHHFRQE
uniref:Uncharacterized protein n=1 Tax=Arundo donax TaxID=35708 RepID=A0A0A8Y3N5_ARUDO